MHSDKKLVLVLLGGMTLLGQEPRFEVASVKPRQAPLDRGRTALMQGGPGTASPSRFTANGVRLDSLIARAWGVALDQVVGPSWMDGEMFDVAATMPAGTSAEKFQLMLQNLLKERFRLALHHETRNFPGYELVVAPGGARVKLAVPDPDGPARERPTSIPMGKRGTVKVNRTVTMAQFCKSLGGSLNLAEGLPFPSPEPRVVDKTGLSGVFDIHLEFDGVLVTGGTPVGNDPVGAPSLFVALEKQLGLRLVKVQKIPVDVLVVDRVERVPAAN